MIKARLTGALEKVLATTSISVLIGLVLCIFVFLSRHCLGLLSPMIHQFLESLYTKSTTFVAG